MGVTIDNDLVSILLYADDIVLLSENETDMQRMAGCCRFMVQQMAVNCK